MELDQSVHNEIVGAIPGLRAFAFNMAGCKDRADDLVQETLLRALTHVRSFQPGTNIMAWLATILRNQFYSEYRKRRREVEDADSRYAAAVVSLPSQEPWMAFQELRAALTKLPNEQREAIILVNGLGFSYDQVAAICGCPVGTIKSRVSRARAALAKVLRTERKGAPYVPYSKPQHFSEGRQSAKAA